MRRSLVCVSVTFIAALAVSGAVPARAQQTRKGTVIVPPSNVVPPQYRGKRAHTNFLIFQPAKGGLVGTAPAGETPSSLACVYNVGSQTLTAPKNTNCPVIHDSSGSSTMNYDNPGYGSNVIAIVDAYDYPTAKSDFQVFSQMFGLPYGDTACSGGPCFTQVYAAGSQPRTNGGWAQEEALDIEWSHAMAPNAQIVLVEAASNSNTDLLQAVSVANSYIANHGGKGEVSMSWGSSESSSEISLDSNFTQPGVTYFASSGDSGGKVIWPSASPDVVSAGGTTVNRDSSGNFTSETTWSSAGAGPSSYEAMPPYQDVTTDINNTGNRGTPDISFDANPSTGVSVYDSTASQGLSGWLVFGGTSVSSPSLAGIVNNAGAFDGGWDGGSNTSSVQNNLYSNYAADATSTTDSTTCSYSSSTPFYDITSGSAGTYNAGRCWDFASGIGSLRGLTGPTGSGGSSGSAPLAPTLTATAGNAQVSLTWTTSSGATSYEVFRSTTSGGETSSPAIATTSATSYTDTGLSNGTTYYYEVEAVNNYGTAYSNQVSATPLAGNFTITAGNITVTQGSSASTTVTVTPSGNFSANVTLSVTGLPNSVSGIFSPNPVDFSNGTTSTLTVTAGPHGPAKTYTLTITGTGGSLSHSITVTLTVNK